ncbi:MAG: hypothetical protein QOJ67_4196 [Acidimicrobiaceae bacterium]
MEKSRTARTKANFKSGQGPDTVSVEAEVEMVKDPKVLSDQLASFANSAVADCFKTAFESQVTKGSTKLTGLQVNFVKLDGIGDGGGTFKITGTVSASGVEVPISVEINLVKTGRAALSLTVTAINSQTDHDLAVTSLKTMAGRVQ